MGLSYDESLKQRFSDLYFAIYSAMRKGFSQPNLLLDTVNNNLIEYTGLKRSCSYAEHKGEWVWIRGSTHF